MERQRCIAGLIGGLVLLAGPAAAQDQPCVPVQAPAARAARVEPAPATLVVGDLTYRRAGAGVPFDAQRMVRVGQRGTQPIYADATVEPWSQLLLPAAGGWLQPYDRLRAGAMAGTSGSRAPSFPVALDRDGDPGVLEPVRMAAAPPVRPPGEREAVRPCVPRPTATEATRAVAAPLGAADERVPTSRHTALVTLPLAAPDGNRGVWIRFADATWLSEGRAVPRAGLSLTSAGHLGYGEVFRIPDKPDTLYVPVREGWVARFTRAR